MPIPVTYRKSGEAITAYDYTDIAAGTGVEIFYGGNTSGAHILSTDKFYSAQTMTQKTGSQSGSWTKALDLDFDVKFNLQRVIEGTLLANIPVGLWFQTQPKTYKSYAHVYIRKWDGTTETDIADKQGLIWTYAATSVSDESVIDAIDVVIPKTVFKAGETLRVTVELWEDGQAASTYANYIGHSPNNRVTSLLDDLTITDTNPHIMTVQVPFKLDL